MFVFPGSCTEEGPAVQVINNFPINSRYESDICVPVKVWHTTYEVSLRVQLLIPPGGCSLIMEGNWFYFRVIDIYKTPLIF